MNTDEHLQLIKTECERLLAIAEKRTQGEWIGYENPTEPYQHNENFIAACAGRAEAGWKATIAVINEYLRFWNVRHEDKNASAACHSRAVIIHEILAAWPIELLTNKPQ